MSSPTTLTVQQRRHLQRCVDLAREALEDGDEPFGSVLTDAAGTELFSDRNRVAGGDHTRHPELEIARWAAAHLTPQERATAIVYTSGEHCPMCAAAHAWVGLGRIVYASSSEQLMSWHREWGLPPGPVAALPINQVAPNIEVVGPDDDLAADIKKFARSAAPGADVRVLAGDLAGLQHLRLEIGLGQTDVHADQQRLAGTCPGVLR